MTTHDQRDVTDSYDESQTEAPGMSAAQQQTQSSSPVAPGEDPAVAERDSGSRADGEPPTEEMLFADDELADLRTRWAGVQAAFVDDPKDCVQKADVLVSDLVDQLTAGFAHARSRLEEQWARGEEASTEDLRLALMHYREFFERLLAV
jgi:hypothetical protein